MMLEPATAFERACEFFDERLSSITPAQYELATPCDGWDVKALLQHVIGGISWYTLSFRGESWPRDGVTDVVGDDAADALGRAAAAFKVAYDEPGALDRDVTLPWGTVPGRMALGVITADVLTHSWDLALALEESVRLPDELVAYADRVVRELGLDQYRSMGLFGPELVVGPDAAPTERFLAYLGRPGS